MSTFDLFIIFGPLCLGAVLFAIAAEVVRVKGSR